MDHMRISVTGPSSVIFITHKNTHLIFGLTAVWLYNQFQKKVFNVVERVVLLISTA